MTSALTALNPSASAAATRAQARAATGHDKPASGTPFSNLLDGEAAAEPATAKAETKAEAKADRLARKDEAKAERLERKTERLADKGKAEDVGDDEDPLTPPPEAPAVPAWLQALRTPPPATPTPGPADAALGKANEQAGAVATAVIGAGLGIGAGRTQKLVGSELETPTLPSLTNGRFGSIRALAGAADADPALPAPELPLATGTDGALTATQTQALDTALDQLAVKTEATPTPIAVLPERGSSPPPVAAPAAVDSTASLLAAGQSPALDAFGEPLSLDGPDAAVRMGERLRWLTEAGVQEARMQLHPKELGAVDVRIRIENQTANVWFGADHPAARAALESTLPQLRERLAADGLQLGQAQVGTQAQAQSQGQGSGGEGRQEPPAWGRSFGTRAEEQTAATPASDRVTAALARHRGLVDRYA